MASSILRSEILRLKRKCGEIECQFCGHPQNEHDSLMGCKHDYGELNAPYTQCKCKGFQENTRDTYLMNLKGKKSLAIIRGDNPLLIGIMELQIAIAEIGRGENQKALMNIESARRFVKNITEKNISEYQEKKIAEMKLNFETEQMLIELVQFYNNTKTENERLMQQVAFDEMIGELVMQNVKVNK